MMLTDSMSKEKRGRGFFSIKDCVNVTIQQLEECTKHSNEKQTTTAKNWKKHKKTQRQTKTAFIKSRKIKDCTLFL